MNVKLLAIDTGVEPMVTEFHELPTDDREKLKETILGLLNKLGKNSHVLLGWNGKLFQCSHTAKRGPSNVYHREEIRYHRFGDQVR